MLRVAGVQLRSAYAHCHLRTHFLFSSVQHPFFSSCLSRLDSHLYKKWSAISLALGLRHKTVYTHFEACELRSLVLLKSSSLFSAHLHFAQGVVKPYIPSMHHRAMHIHDTLTFLLLQGHLQLGLLISDASEFLLELFLCFFFPFQLSLN